MTAGAAKAAAVAAGLDGADRMDVPAAGPRGARAPPHRSSSERGTSDVETPYAESSPYYVSTSPSPSGCGSLDDRGR